MRITGLAILCLVLGLANGAVAQKKAKVVMPANAPAIKSGFHSRRGVNGGLRSGRHQGIDIAGPNGQPIIAVADGVVLDRETGKCWGPTVLIDHGKGRDGKPLIVAYGHVGQIVVKKGQKVRRGQLVARLGNNHKKFRCISGVRHLHLQIGRKARLENRRNSWGHVRYLVDGKKGVNPHAYWADGPGRVTCYRKGGRYPAGTLTYPLPCR